ncbi:acyclic terpene utilization AtuA family protein [Brevibacillus sp. H7]|uniref:acyclic terpene utilization AtuA family protein n=1 Tax=Brevibacillus sp. H7 TaxID=3349138 RepID=UPI003800F9C8
MKRVRIGAGQGFYGDTIFPAVEIAKRGDVDYLCFDCLAELTMAILVKDRNKNPEAGYTKDITASMKALLPYVKEKGIKLLTNAGGMNPQAAAAEVMRVATEMGMDGVRIAVVTGDQVVDRLKEWEEKGISLDDMETRQSFSSIADRLMFANAYIGAWPIVQALREGADIVVTGRTTDTAQFLAPLIYEFGWQEEEWDKLASGVFMGHLLECSAQSTGGNFSGAWWDVEGMERIGYPIAEVMENGEFTITKVEGSGGLVSVDTVKEQMLYEIHDPSMYITPDVVVDLLDVALEQTGPNRVKVSGVRGKERPDTWKVVMGYENGYMGQVIVGFSWPDALRKAQKADEIIRKQLEILRWSYEEIRTDYLGYNSLHGPLAQEPKEELNEVYLRMAVRARSKEDAARFGRLFPPLALNGPPTLSGFTGMQPPRELIGMWSSLVPREEIEPYIDVRIMEVGQHV